VAYRDEGLATVAYWVLVTPCLRNHLVISTAFVDHAKGTTKLIMLSPYGLVPIPGIYDWLLRASHGIDTLMQEWHGPS